ncbi:hypothetical protein BCR42DRAFT_93378 [Absidia repens]|uniref:Xylanolytic transcriptional activator regulatory domain-containing protein n=1 Tax=Absidia repens TaxID=90262 RepID=A0A1X2IZ45_9FUNG|nr:hypothetical protein BCR42DRAFT_93378 [Absidia repens]
MATIHSSHWKTILSYILYQVLWMLCKRTNAHQTLLWINRTRLHYIKNDFFMKDDRLATDYLKWTSSYFAHFNVFFPVLSQPHYMQQLLQQNVDPLLFYAVCTIGAKYSDGDQETSQFLFERCQHVLNMSHDSATLCTMQALVILCWYAHLLAKMQTCTELRQRLNQAVNDLQLFWDHGSSLGIVSVEMYRRAFWVAYVTDQWLSSCTGERLLVLPDGWNCQWPRLEDSQLLVIDNKQSRINNNDEMIHTQEHQQIRYQYQRQHQHRNQSQQVNDSPAKLSHSIPDLSAEYALQITAFSEMIKLACIVDEVHDLYASSSKTPVWHHQQTIASRLTHWLVHLPFYLEYDKPKHDAAPSPIARIYHMLYYTVQIMLYQPYLQQVGPMTVKSTQTPPASFNLAQSPASAPPSPLPNFIGNNPITASDINMARSICTNAANTIVHISEQMIQHNQYMYLHNTFLISLTLASSMQLDNAMNLDKRHGISSLFNLGKSFDVLKNCNCTVLSSIKLEQLLNRFLLDHYGIRLDGKNRDSCQSARATCRHPCQKRTSVIFMDEAPTETSNIDDYDYTPGHVRKRRHQINAEQLSCTTHSLTQVSPSSSPLIIMNVENNSNKDDLLDTRLHHLLQSSYPYTTSFSNSIPSPSASSSASNVLDPSWLDETSSILDLFPEVPAAPQCYSSNSSCYTATPTDTLYSPVSFISPTHSPTLSSDSNLHTVITSSNNIPTHISNDYGTGYYKSAGQYGCPFTPRSVNVDFSAFMSDSAIIPPYTH